jgi:predicted transcriptional regulator
MAEVYRWRRITTMPNVAAALKEEVSRLARKELKSNTDSLKRAVASYRTQIAALKRRVDSLERHVKRVARAKPAAGGAGNEEGGTALRFRPDGLKKHRERLGLSAADAAKIMGVSAVSVYKWENGRTRPRAKQLEAVATLRKLGKKEAAARLAK